MGVAASVVDRHKLVNESVSTLIDVEIAGPYSETSGSTDSSLI